MLWRTLIRHWLLLLIASCYFTFIDIKLLTTAHIATAGFKIANEMWPKIWMISITVRPKLRGGINETGLPSQCIVEEQPMNISVAVPSTSANTMQHLSNVLGDIILENHLDSRKLSLLESDECVPFFVTRISTFESISSNGNATAPSDCLRDTDNGFCITFRFFHNNLIKKFTILIFLLFEDIDDCRDEHLFRSLEIIRFIFISDEKEI